MHPKDLNSLLENTSVTVCRDAGTFFVRNKMFLFLFKFRAAAISEITTQYTRATTLYTTTCATCNTKKGPDVFCSCW